MAKKKMEPDKVSGKVFVALNRATGIAFKMPDGRKVAISGNAAHMRGGEAKTLPVGAFGLTLVDAADWEWIKNAYGGMEIFKSGLIHASDARTSVLDEADEKSGTRHGLEPVDPRQPQTGPAGGDAA